MLKNTLILTLVTSVLSSCVIDPESNLKRSANNRLFDMEGFHSKKRSPLYNKKYIKKAKMNIIKNNLEEDEYYDDEDYDDEDRNIKRENIEMYKAMIDADLHNRRVKKKRKKRFSFSWPWSRKKKEDYSSSSEVHPRTHAQNLELREELNQIKSMLRKTKRDMASYKCPTAEEQERKSLKAQDTLKTTQDRLKPNNMDQGEREFITPDHVHSL